MQRVYLDKNIFSYIRSQNLEDRFMSLKDNFVFFYSPAHLSDLQNCDYQDKIDDLQHMGKVVDSNLIYNQPKKGTRFSELTPLEALSKFYTPNTFQELTDDLPNFLKNEFLSLLPEDLRNNFEESFKALFLSQSQNRDDESRSGIDLMLGWLEKYCIPTVLSVFTDNIKMTNLGIKNR